MNKLALLGAVIGAAFTFGAVAHADETATHIPVTRDGKTTTRVAYQFWSGEYPGPIIDVGGSNKGTTTIKAFKSLRKLDQPVKCTIKNGLYHPWSNEKVSPHSFYSIVSQQAYKVVEDVELDSQTVEPQKLHLAKGSTVQDVVYYGEGMCGASAVSGPDSANVKLDIVIYCDDVTSKSFSKISPEDSFYEQWLYLTCEDGSKAFVGSKSILKQKGVIAGELEGYGSVKRATKTK